MFRLICASAALVATVAMAQAPDEATRNGADEDPNEVICVDQPNTGSRVNRVRVCRTRAQWDATRARNRKSLERDEVRTSGN